MAEFKLGRIRYTWSGAWAPGSIYDVDEVVSYAGKTYVSLTQHTASADFYTDLDFLNADVPPVAAPKWQLMVDGYRWRTDWTVDTFYAIGDLIKYEGLVYLCLDSHTSGSTIQEFETDLVYWAVYTSTIQWRNQWTPDTYYTVNDQVKVNGTIYICVETHTSADNVEDGIDIDLDKWDIYLSTDKWKNDWAADVRYQLNDVVRFGGIVYRCLVAHTSSDPFEDDIANWAEVHVGIDYKGTWIAAEGSSSIRYKVGDIVKYGGDLWKCTVAHDTGVSFNELNWQLFAPGTEYEALWNSGAVYQPGDIVRYGGYLYSSNTLHQTKEPPRFPEDWTVVRSGAKLVGRWNAETAYDIGSVVAFGGQLYVAVDNTPTDSSVQTPAVGTADNSEYWELIVPGDRWVGDWSTGTSYAIGDLVHWISTTYRCINVHTAGSGNRPDVDTLHTYWEILIVGDSANKLKIVGDIKTYESGDTTAVTLADKGYIIKAVDGLPTWSKLNESEKVYYVSPTGTDGPTQGTTLNSPWRSIRYACENVTGPATIFIKTGLYQEVLPIIIPATVALVGDELRGTVVEPAPTLVPTEDAPNTLIAIQYLRNLIQSLAISDANLATVNTALTANLDTIYNIIDTDTEVASFGTNTLTVVTASLDAATTLSSLRTDLAEQVVEYVQLTYPTFNAETCKRDIELIVDALVYDIRYPGNYKSKLAANYYANAADGERNALSDMFYMRTATGIRNMTLRGLVGEVTPVTELGLETRRVTGGAYVSFDPGWGPDDERTWITTRSPYTQNVTTFGTGCVGMKLNGELHNGGNKTMVANDFTQVLSDGIGVWVNKDARTEIVSVFTYYNYIGYLAENGGKIRATNGNNSYGIYGSVSEGVNPTESPITATVNNKYNDATVGSVLTDEAGAIIKLFYSNAGQTYTNASYSISGAGLNANLVADEFRDGGVTEVRVVDPGDSTASGGGSYVFTTNSAQYGDEDSITLAAADENESSTYVGMRVLITRGTGVGQYGYITEYDDLSKIALVSKESDDQPGWDNFVAGTETASALDTTSEYVIEPRVTFSSPGSSIVPGTLSSLKHWRSVTSGAGKFVAIGHEIDNGAGNFAAYSTDGVTWTAATLPATEIWTTVKFGNEIFVALSTGTSTAYSTDGISWTAGTINEGEWTDLTYGGGKFVAVSSGGTQAAYSTNGITWTTSTLPEGADWSGVTYGKGRFVAVSYSDSSTTNTAYSTDGITWNTGSFAGGCSCVAYGNGKFVAFDGAVSGNTVFYSTDGASWTSVTIDSPQTWKSVTYGQGRFIAVATDEQNVLTSTDGVTWSTLNTTVNAAWTSVVHGMTSSGIGKFVIISGSEAGSTTVSVVQAGVTAQARVQVVSGRISSVDMWEPGSGYSGAPVMTLTDPNNTSDVVTDIYIGDGVLGNPSAANSGTGYGNRDSVITITGDGYMESFQLGKNLIVSNLSRVPSPGDNLNIEGINDYTYKVTSVTVLEGTSAPYTARIVMIKGLERAESPTHGTNVYIREQYSQVRITGHDLLDIGLGNFEQTNFPDILNPVGTVKSPENELLERNGGRVFYTSTNDLGDFRVGELFAVEQATGTVTLNADFFSLQGLEELRLGGVTVGGTNVVIREFSTDATFTADSNNIIPTERAIKAYLTRRVSGGGSDAITGGITAGVVVVGPNRLTTTSLGEIEVTSDVNFKRGVSGMMLAQAFFTRRR